MNRFLAIIVVAVLGNNFANAQRGSVATGSMASGTGGTSAYSIGQIDYITVSSITGTVSQGLQQPYEIQIMTGVEINEINLSLSVFPNPSSEFIVLTICKPLENNMIYVLVDASGKLLTQQEIINEKTNISTSELANGIYFLNITKNNSAIKSFKIIKNN